MRNYSEEKENFFKKQKEKYKKKLNQYRKYNISLIVIFTVVMLIDFALTLIDSQGISYFKLFNFLDNKSNFLLGCFFVFSLFYLCHIYVSKNEYFRNKNYIRIIADFIFILQFFYIMIYGIYLVLKIVCMDYEEIISYYSLIILIVIVSLYILTSILKNIIKLSYSTCIVLILLFIIIFFSLGAISTEKFLIAILIAGVVNEFFSFEVSKYFYSKLRNNVDYDIDEICTKENLPIKKFYVSLFLLFIYIFILITEYFKFGILRKMFYLVSNVIFQDNLSEIEIMNIENKCFPEIIQKAYERLIFLPILILFIYIIFMYKLKKLKPILKNIMKEYVIVLSETRKSKNIKNKTNIKTSIHINSRKNSHRIYKYKNIEFHNKKPNSN